MSSFTSLPDRVPLRSIITFSIMYSYVMYSRNVASGSWQFARRKLNSITCTHSKQNRSRVKQVTNERKRQKKPKKLEDIFPLPFTTRWLPCNNDCTYKPWEWKETTWTYTICIGRPKYEKEPTRKTLVWVIHQFPGSLVLKGGGGNPGLLRQELVVVCLLQIEFHILERLALTEIIIILPTTTQPHTGIEQHTKRMGH